MRFIWISNERRNGRVLRGFWRRRELERRSGRRGEVGWERNLEIEERRQGWDMLGFEGEPVLGIAAREA
ncbi:hypothetical protein Ddye_014485 [Dipteronia dyeriana]|uniref:Uncharacterized protein n=1 Tax=Dipteronia dyeriana TaxID=168575 RepID=A0AAD9X892_9ROSI|nr:hypothetical protein Ddye_014485 [Dipteronia dyeriana]